MNHYLEYISLFSFKVLLLRNLPINYSECTLISSYLQDIYCVLLVISCLQNFKQKIPENAFWKIVLRFLRSYTYTKYCLFKATFDSESTISKADIFNDSIITKILKVTILLSHDKKFSKEKLICRKKFRADRAPLYKIEITSQQLDASGSNN